MFSRFSSLSFRLRQIGRAAWFLPLAFSIVAVATVALSLFIARFAPHDLPITIDHGALQSILTILASSMLTIAVFSLSTLVAAVSQASQATTPRAVPLIIEDRTAQTPISVFIGAFLYSIVGIIGLSSGIYSDAGRLVLFFVTLGVVVLVVAALIRWIGHTVRIGRTGETISLVERAATKAMHSLEEAPRFGCRARRGPVPAGVAVRAEHAGYLQHVNPSRLNDLTEGHEATIHVLVWPGAVVLEGMAIAVVTGALDEGKLASVRGAFSIGDQRTFEYDPRYGITVLAEIASRALSPAINDQGTALDVISALVRTLAAAPQALAEPDDEPQYPQVTLPPIDAQTFTTSAFRPIARDGADKVEIALRLAKGLVWLAHFAPYKDAAEQMLIEVRTRCDAAMSYRPDREMIDAKIAELRLRYSSESDSPPDSSAS